MKRAIYVYCDDVRRVFSAFRRRSVINEAVLCLVMLSLIARSPLRTDGKLLSKLHLDPL